MLLQQAAPLHSMPFDEAEIDVQVINRSPAIESSLAYPLLLLESRVSASK